MQGQGPGWGDEAGGGELGAEDAGVQRGQGQVVEWPAGQDLPHPLNPTYAPPDPEDAMAERQ